MKKIFYKLFNFFSAMKQKRKAKKEEEMRARNAFYDSAVKGKYTQKLNRVGKFSYYSYEKKPDYHE